MSAVNFNNQELALYSNSFIVPKYINAPYTQIQNRAQVLDSSNMLQAVMGVERIPFRGINLLQKEFGPNGEQVWELESKDARIRMVGGGWQTQAGVAGTFAYTANVNDYLEVVFYGTGLNILSALDTGGRDFRATIDNGAEGSNIYVQNSAVIVGRNYNANTIVSVVSGLSLGWHFVKIRLNATGMVFYGIEVLNQSTSLTIPQGQAFIGSKKESLNALTTSAYNAGIVGTKGARVVKYLKDGNIYSAITECASTPSYLTNANHTNEEVVRRINFREFGVNRADDFSTLSTARASAFTLDDGTTTLVTDASQVIGTGDMVMSNTGNFFTITFIGTGLDIFRYQLNGNSEVYVDGSLKGSLAGTEGNLVKICSGLPYGTHTIKFNRNVIGAYTHVSDFIIYQPKKPSIPNGAIEVADYCVMSNYVANTISGVATIATGVLRKLCTREVTYVGTWSMTSVDVGFTGGFGALSGALNDYFEYTFYGSGFEIRFENTSGGAVTSVVTVDGSTNLSGFTTSFYGAGISSFTSATGTLITTTVSTQTNGISVSNLTLGKHTVRVQKTAGSFNWWLEAVDIITPIHINSPSLKIGSLSLLDNNKIQALALPVSGQDLSKAKAWVLYDQVNSKILGSYNVSQVLANGVGVSFVYFSKPFKNTNYALVGGGAHYQMTTNVSASNYCRASISDSGGISANATFALAAYGELIDE